MENIVDITSQTIKKLILESEWGRTAKNEELEDYLIDEVHEFIESIYEEKEDHMMEEAADVVMMLLYLVMKNRDDLYGNPISDILNRINEKLRTRYAVFFEGISDGSEEENWKEAKHIEKEIHPYLFCKNENCKKYGKKNQGQLVFREGCVSCHSCGSTWKIDGNNLLLGRCKTRRKLIEDFKKSLLEYQNGRIIAADEYFASHLDDYLIIMRYAVSYPVGYMAFQDYFIQDKCCLVSELNEFLVLPLRNYIHHTLSVKDEEFKRKLKINDILIQWLNKGYLRFRTMFCRKDNDTDRKILLNYFRNIIASMDVRMQKSEMTTTYVDEIICHGEKKEGKLMVQYSLPRKSIINGDTIKLYVEGIRSTVDVVSILYSIIITTGIRYKTDILLRIHGVKDIFNTPDFTELVLDMYPMIVDVQEISEF